MLAQISSRIAGGTGVATLHAGPAGNIAGSIQVESFPAFQC